MSTYAILCQTITYYNNEYSSLEKEREGISKKVTGFIKDLGYEK